MAQAKGKQSPPIESAWVAKILRASGPDSVRVRAPGSQLRTDERNEIPRENERWLVLQVELKALPNSTIDTEEIKVVDEGSAMYSAKGLNWQQNSFILFSEMPSGLAVSPGKGSGGPSLSTHRKDSTKPAIERVLGDLPAISCPCRSQARVSSVEAR
jgi:hypothetical protein